MKSCSHNRSSLVLLAIDGLSASEQRELRAHIRTCEACRTYLQEVSNVTQKLGTVDLHSEIQTSEAFHQRVVRALRVKETVSTRSVLAQLREALLNWRVALPLAAATARLIAGFMLFTRPSTIPAPNIAKLSSPNVKTELDPSIFNYEMIANRSLDKLDEVLDRQASRNSSASSIYTAANLPQANLLD